MANTAQESARRLQLQKKMKEELPSLKAVYFQPPKEMHMQYPCIRYSWDGQFVKTADDQMYIRRRRYSVTIIDANPDSDIPQEFEKVFPLASFDRPYVADNLHHWVYSIYW